MHQKIPTICFIIQLLLVTGASAQDPGPLLKSFDNAFSRHLANPTRYSQTVSSECRQFPEGSLFPYTLVALAWCHKIYGNPATANTELPKIETLLELALISSAKVVKPPNGSFTEMTGMGKQGTFVSQLAIALAAYRLAGGQRSDLISIENRLNTILVNEVAARKGQPIYSYPGEIWPFDTTAALFSIELHDRVTGNKSLPPLLQQHKNWVLNHGIDSSTGLPASQILPNGKLVVARGCDLSWRLAFWSEMDSAQSSQWYRNYHSRFWKSSTLAKGFREWSSDKIKTVDLDSGPILYGVGSTATAMGLCSALAHSDSKSAHILFTQANSLAEARNRSDFVSRMKVSTMNGALNKIGIPTSKQYLTGFLFGDATAFYAMSWTSYPKKPVR